MRNSEPLKEFIRQNWQSFTITEMAKDFGVSTTAVSVHCKKMGIRPITEKEKTILVIRNHPNLIPEQLAPILKMAAGSIRNLISRENLRPHKKAVVVNFVPKTNPNPKPKFIPKELKEEDDKGYEITPEEELTARQWKEKQKQLRENRANYTKYNQTHSPFGFADELRGIHSTKDPQPFYMELVRL